MLMIKNANRKLFLLIFSYFFSIVVVFSFQISCAESLDIFDATIYPPQSQTNKKLLYYDLLLKPQQNEKLKVALTNKTDKELELVLSFNRAKTNSVGVVDYSNSFKDTSKTAQINIEEIVGLSNESVLLAPKETIDIYLNVTMPRESFEGVLAGGLYIEQVSKGKIEGNIRNIFSREIAILIRNTEKKVEPNLIIERAFASQTNYRNTVTVDIENNQPEYLKNISVNYVILLNEKEKIIEGSKKQLNMAPNTRMSFIIPFAKKEFDSGLYSVKVNVNAEKKKWQETLFFEMEEKTAEKYNKKDVSIEKETITIPFIESILFIGLLILIAVLIQKNNGLNKKLKKKKSIKKRK